MWWFFEEYGSIVLIYQLQLSSHDYERKMEGLFFSLVFTEPQYMYFDSKLLSTLLIQFKLVYRPVGQSNMLSKIDFCPPDQPGRKHLIS